MSDRPIADHALLSDCQGSALVGRDGSVDWLVPVPGGVVSDGSSEGFALSSPVALTPSDGLVRSRVGLRSGQRLLGFALQHVPAGEQARMWSQRQVWDGLADTVAGWRSWSRLHQSYRGPWRELVDHSGRVLQALTYQPSGAIVAAPTTSLPESVGGERNWDYRYAWMRDAAFTLDALWVAACPDEARAFFSWMVDAAAGELGDGGRMQVVFGVRGEHDLTEQVLDHLSGWRGSRPVRTGNGAWRQRQLDVYGELLAAAHRLRPQLGDLQPDTCRFFTGLAEGAAAHWQEPDHGIWEVRGRPQHVVYSKLMCWVALDRAIALAGDLGAEHRVDTWTRTREEIRAAIEQHGWNERAGAYTQAFGSDVLDASVLMMPIVGFTPAGSPRMRAPIRAVTERLTDPRGLVHRYQTGTDDGLPGAEGAFLLCTFWLAHTLALAADPAGAREVFDRAIRHANDVALLAEEVDPATGELLGNFPQALSHIGLINAAWAIAQAEAEDRTGGPLAWESWSGKAGLGTEGRGACRRT